MLHKLIQKAIGVLLIIQSIIMILSSYTSIQILHPFLFIESICLLIMIPFIFKKHWFLYIIFTIIATGILIAEYFPVFKTYYKYLSFVPLIIGIAVLILGYKKSSKSQPSGDDK